MPIDRMRVLTLLAEPISLLGTDSMISAGIAPYARPTPPLMMIPAVMTPHVDPMRNRPAKYPTAMTIDPRASVSLGPRVPMSRPLTGETAIIARPAGADHRPIATIDWPRP